MTNDPLERHLRELSWRKNLTHTEQARLRAWLAEHPETQAEWETEAALTEALGQMPDVPVPSNFTARVMQAAEREAADQQHARPIGWFWRWPARWLPKAAIASVILGSGIMAYQHARVLHTRAEIAGSLQDLQKLVVASGVSKIPEAEQLDSLENFEVICALTNTPLEAVTQTAMADDRLLELLQ
jgi:hypothetical protein